MTVYVDDFEMRVTFPGRRTMVMSHMVADTHEELMDMALKLKLKAAWLQYAGEPDEHFDVSLTTRAEAIRLGAKLVKPRDVVEVIRRKRNVL